MLVHVIYLIYSLIFYIHYSLVTSVISKMAVRTVRHTTKNPFDQTLLEGPCSNQPTRLGQFHAPPDWRTLFPGGQPARYSTSMTHFSSSCATLTQCMQVAVLVYRMSHSDMSHSTCTAPIYRFHIYGWSPYSPQPLYRYTDFLYSDCCTGQANSFLHNSYPTLV